MKASVLVLLATLSAGISVSQGQETNVIVNFGSGWNMLANPLSAGVTNGANEIMPLIDGEVILTWNNTAGRFVQTSYDSGFAGWVGGDGVTPSVSPSLPPGTGFVLFNPGPAISVTFKGRVMPGQGTTNYLALPGGYSLLGSALPATVTNITSAPVALPLIDGMQILTWTRIAYDYSSYDSGFGGWVGSDFNPKPAPAYAAGQGFFFYNPGPARTWEQSSP